MQNLLIPIVLAVFGVGISLWVAIGWDGNHNK